MKSSLCAGYITELIYFPLKITQPHSQQKNWMFWWGSSLRYLGSVEYPFIAITHRYFDWEW